MTIFDTFSRMASDRCFPSFRKGGLGRISKERQRKSPSVPLFQRGITESNDIQKIFQLFIASGTSIVIAILSSLSLPRLLLAQSKTLKEVRVPYALGGSTGFFWVAQRSGSFEKYGIKVLPIFMRGGREAVQALISRDVMMNSGIKDFTIGTLGTTGTTGT